eukprot:Hpha_TRINITY_DN22259_c0_g1::TRINITY_DN22259_c0_g1_i1::g.167084::m.167084
MSAAGGEWGGSLCGYTTRGTDSSNALSFYIALCEERGLEPCLELVAALSTGSPACSLVDRAAPITDADAAIICMVLDKFPALQVLNMEGNDIGQDGVVRVAAMLKKNTSLITLRMGKNRFRDGGCVTLSNAIRVNKHLRELDLSYNRITNVGCKALAAALAESPSLRELVLHGNAIDGSAAERLCSSLLSSPGVLSRLHFGYNNLGDRGALALASYLPHGVLETLDLAGNRIGDEAAIQILRVTMEGQGCLQRLNLRSNHLTGVSFQAAADAIHSPRCTLKALLLGHNPAGGADVAKVITACGAGSELEIFDAIGIPFSLPTHRPLFELVAKGSGSLTRLLFDGISVQSDDEHYTAISGWNEAVQRRHGGTALHVGREGEEEDVMMWEPRIIWGSKEAGAVEGAPSAVADENQRLQQQVATLQGMLSEQKRGAQREIDTLRDRIDSLRDGEGSARGNLDCSGVASDVQSSVYPTSAVAAPSAFVQPPTPLEGGTLNNTTATMVQGEERVGLWEVRRSVVSTSTTLHQSSTRLA